MSRPKPRLLPILILGAAGLLVLGIQPLLYGAYIHESLIVERRLGTLAAAEISAIACGSMIGIALLKRSASQTVGVIGIVGLIIGNLLPEVASLFVSRAVAGLGGGLLVSLSSASIARQINVNAASGLFLFLQATSQFAIMQGFSLLAPAASAASMQLVLVLLVLLVSPLLLVIPSNLAVTEATQEAGKPPVSGWIALATCSLFLGSAIGIWAYLGVWLESRGLSSEAVAPMITASLAGQMVGALGAVALGTHARSGLQVVASGTAMIAAVLLLMLLEPAGAIGWVLLTGFGLAWMIGTPALSGLVLQADPQRHSLPYAASAQLLGAALIPTLVGETLAPEGLSLVLATCIGLTTVAIMLAPLSLATRSSNQRSS